MFNSDKYVSFKHDLMLILYQFFGCTMCLKSGFHCKLFLVSQSDYACDNINLFYKKNILRKSIF